MFPGICTSYLWTEDFTLSVPSNRQSYAHGLTDTLLPDIGRNSNAEEDCVEQSRVDEYSLERDSEDAKRSLDRHFGRNADVIGRLGYSERLQ